MRRGEKNAKIAERLERGVRKHAASGGCGLVWARGDRARLRPRHRLRLPAHRPRHLRPGRRLRISRGLARAPRGGPGPRGAARDRRGARRGPDRGRPADPHEWPGGSRGARRARLRRVPRPGDGPERGPLRRALDEPGGRAGPARRSAGGAARQDGAEVCRPAARRGASAGARRGGSGRSDAAAADLARATRPRRGRRAVKRLLFAALALAGLAFGVALAAARSVLQPFDPAGSEQVFEVAAGESLPEIARRLEEAGLVRDRLGVELVARSRDLAGRLQRGEYRLSPAQSPQELLDQIASGRVVTHEVSFPEGLTAAQFAERLAHAGLADRDAFLAVVRDPETPGLLGV